MKNGKKIKIGDFIEQVRGVTYSSDDVIENSREGYLPVLRANGIYDGELNFEDLVYVPKKKISNVQLIKKGDIVMAASSGSKEVVGKTAFVIEDWKGGFGAFCKVIRTKPSLNSLYLSFYFRSKIYRGIISSIVTGANINNIRNDDLNNLEIPLPDLETQKEIALVLEQADKARQQRKGANALTDQFLQSSFLSLFGDPVKNEKGWEVRRLDAISRLQRGRFSPRPRNDPSYYHGDYPFIQTGDISRSNGRLNLYTQTLNEKGIKVSKQFKKDVIVIAIVGATIGATAILEIDVYATDSIIGISTLDGLVDNYYLEFVLRFWKPILLKNAPEVARPNINLEILNKLGIILPPLSLQQQFACIVAQAEQLRQKQIESERELENLFQGLLQRYFG